MMLKNTAYSWGLTARLFHWLSASVVVFCLCLGFWMMRVVSDTFEQFALIQLHKSWGFIALSFAVMRIGWRFYSPAPALSDGMPAYQRYGARVGHFLLYTFTLLLPISGWLMASASPIQELLGVENKVFDWFVLYDPIVPGHQGLADILSWVHFGCAIGLCLTLVMHIAAAFWHHLYLKDHTLLNMSVGPVHTSAPPIKRSEA